jgi:hypothetical protein
MPFEWLFMERQQAPGPTSNRMAGVSSPAAGTSQAIISRRAVPHQHAHTHGPTVGDHYRRAAAPAVEQSQALSI